MALYEILLRYHDRDEVRLADSPLEVGGSVEIAGSAWRVQSERALRGRRGARYICVELREDSRELRARSTDLIGSRELPEIKAEPE